MTKPAPGDVMQIFFVNLLGQRAANQRAATGSRNQSQRRTEKDRPLADRVIGRKQHGSERCLVAHLGDKHRDKNSCEYFPVRKY